MRLIDNGSAPLHSVGVAGPIGDFTEFYYWRLAIVCRRPAALCLSPSQALALGAIVTVAMLALGIGFNIAMFTVDMLSRVRQRPRYMRRWHCRMRISLRRRPSVELSTQTDYALAANQMGRISLGLSRYYQKLTSA